MKNYVSYLDDNDKKVSGYFEMLEQNMNFIKIQSGKNIIIIPYQRVLKIKMKPNQDLCKCGKVKYIKARRCRKCYLGGNRRQLSRLPFLKSK